MRFSDHMKKHLKPALMKFECTTEYDMNMKLGFWNGAEMRVCYPEEHSAFTHTLVEHVGLMPQRGVLTQMLLDHLYSLHLQPLQLLQSTNTDKHRSSISLCTALETKSQCGSWLNL